MNKRLPKQAERRRKGIMALCAAIFLLAVGCQPGGDSSDSSPSEAESDPSSSQESSQEPSESSGQAETSGSGSTASEPEPEDPSINGALALIPGGERLLESEKGLFLLKEYGFEMKWMEVNRIEHLDRGTPPVDSQQTYFLLLPKYTGSQILVERMEWDGEDFSPVEALYRNESTPESYGLILTSDEPEASINLRVTVSYQDQQADNLFSYDGRGDRPAVRAFPGDEAWWENEDFEEAE